MARHVACLFDVDIRGARMYEAWAKRARPFVKKDRENLETTLAHFGYESETFTVRTLADLTSKLQQVAKKNWRSYESLFVFISGYGVGDLLYCIDKPVKLNELLQETFDGNRCPGLREKEKIFFIQACDHKFHNFDATEVYDQGTAQAENHRTGRDQWVAEEKFTVYRSHIPGEIRWRDVDQGSMAVDHFCETLNTYRLVTVQDAFLQVSKKMHEELLRHGHDCRQFCDTSTTTTTCFFAFQRQ